MPKHFAEQFEMDFGSHFVVYDLVEVSPEENKLAQALPFTEKFSGKVIEVLDTYFIVKDDKDGQLYSVYPRQCVLKK